MNRGGNAMARKVFFSREGGIVCLIIEGREGKGVWEGATDWVRKRCRGSNMERNTWK